ncbi:MAG: hypothetical protein ACI309_06835 [Candidatus Limisoma sp.]
MLKHLKFLILLVLPFSLAMTLTSCSDDDNENLEDGNEETSLLVGSWEWSNDVELEVWTFNSDGTCKTVWLDSDEHIHVGKYSYNSLTGILLMSMICDEEDETFTEKYKVLHLSSSELVLQETEGSGFGEITTLTRKIQ